MLLFVFFAAIINLSVGYALGSGLKLPVGIPKIPLLRKKKKLDELEDEEPLARPVAEEKEAVPTVQIAMPKATEDDDTDEPAFEAPVLEEEELGKEVNTEESVSEPVAEEGKEDSTVSQGEPEKLLSTKDLMAGLSLLQSQLSNVSEELKTHEDDPEEFEECASRLQEVNHDYIKTAHGTIEQLDQLSNAGDQEAQAASESVTEGCTQVEKASQKIDAIIESELDETARKELLAQSAEIVEKVNDVSNFEASATATPSLDKPEGLIDNGFSLEQLLEKIELAVNQIDKGKTLFVAEAKLDPPKESISEASLLDGITADLNAVIAETMRDQHSYSLEGRRLVFLEGDSLEEACHRAEHVRQTFESTTYLANSATAQATVSCAVSEISSQTPRKDIESQLMAALEEAEQMGANRTFHHDGAFATAITPLELSIEKRVVEV